MPNDDAAKSRMSVKSYAGREKPKKQRTQRASKKVEVKRNALPLRGYLIKEMILDFIRYKNFSDAMAVTFTLLSVSIALPFLPLPLLIPALLITFILGMLHPLIGLAALLFMTLPMFIYQAPLFGWLFFLFITVSLFLGYKHYRSITFTYLLAALPFSLLGFFLEIPAFVLTILTIGVKRAAIVAIAALLLVMVGSGLTNTQLMGPIVFNASSVRTNMLASKVVDLLTPTKAAPDLAHFLPVLVQSFSKFFDVSVTSKIVDTLTLIFIPVIYNLPLILIQLVFWLIAVFAISNYAIHSRSRYKGSWASVFSIMLPISYVLASLFAHMQILPYIFLSYILTPMLLLVLEFSGIDVVRALDVMKSDFRSSFGESFEDLSTGARETFNNIANYEQVKRELREAVLAPIEHRELAGAYNIRPAKGILLFGPPGTGKTLIMRALANEIRAGFFYVKASSILSPYPGESAKEISRIFSIAKKHAPSILFFDEIDGIAGSRDNSQSETGREILSTLLSELDGFQTQNDLVVVGATNMPQLLDSGLMRPGRFDKIIYMSLPDAKGRDAIFQYYLKKLPVSEAVDYSKLVEVTNRYSPADIKNICDEAARRVADYASTQNKVLAIRTEDLLAVIKETKASTSLAKLEEYNQFKIDYERRAHGEPQKSSKDAVSIKDVVGLTEAKKALYEAVELPIVHPDLVKKYDVRNIRGMLLFGPSGTGKTMLMRAIANEIGPEHFVQISGAEISNYGIERAVATVKKQFDRAKENAPSLVFVDEIDSIVSNRDNASELGVQLTSEFLEELDGLKDRYNVVLIATTNRPDSMDPALLRPGRLDKLIFVAPPNAEERAELFKINLEKAPMAEGINYTILAEKTSGFTGADIANMCRQTKMDVLERSIANPQDGAITQDDLLEIIQKSKPSAPTVVVGKYLSFLSRYGQR